MPDKSYREFNKIAHMDWEDFKNRLEPSTRGAGARSGAEEQEMEDYFGKEEYAELKEAAAQVKRTRSRAGALGNVILLPGIMGSNLAVVNGGDEDTIWVSLLRIAMGSVDKLRLYEDGSEAIKVKATSVEKRTYARALIKLSARWDIKPFPFDWRKDIDSSADALNDFITGEFGDKPAHIVAHSMGGLVGRNFIRRHHDTWAKMRGDGSRGGRLIMLGTPNYGSFAIPQVMTGTETLVRWLARLDLSHDRTQILDIINTFVGTYQLLPAPSKIPEDARALYNLDTWGDFRNSILPGYLARAEKFHSELESDKTTINPERMIYIAGCNRKTLAGLTMLEPGEFQYEVTINGDGRVPFALGLLDGVPTYYVDEGHGNLPKNDKIIAAVDQLLEMGRTTALSTRPVTARGVIPRETRWHRPISEHYTGTDLEEIANRAREGKASKDEVRAAELAVMRAVMGDDRPERDVAEINQVKRMKPADKRNVYRPPLAIEVIHGDITLVNAPIVVVGQYKGVAPINAIGALDKALGRWISQANSRSMIGAELGQLFFIPVKKGQLGADSVLLAGMGEEGRFSQADLRYLVSNVTYAISSLEASSFATVLIGGGAGNLSEIQALRGLLFGICDALQNLRKDLKSKEGGPKLRRVKIIENREDRFNHLYDILKDISGDDSAVNFKVTVTKREKSKEEATANEALQLQTPPQQSASQFYPRITIEHSGDVFKFSALTQSAVISVRDVPIQSFFSDGIADRLVNSSTREEQITLGRMLHHLFPRDFQQLFNSTTPLSLILDSTSASIPWEMACFTRPDGPAFFGTDINLTRQFRTLLSSAPGDSIAPRNKLRVLVIADPAPEPELQLPGARKEGRAVAQVLNQIKNKWKLDIDLIDRVGPDECDPIQLLGLIFDGGFDIIHYAGHGFYDESKPSYGGWVLGRNVQLTAREIFLMRRAPRLIFANACFSSVVNKQLLTAEQMNKNLAGIAEAFFERGVANYLGAGWPVQDDLAVRFATAFYSYALAGRLIDENQQADNSGAGGTSKKRNGKNSHPRLNPFSLGEALSEARKLIIHDGSTWGAYQHYGYPGSSLMAVSRPASSKAPGPERKRPVKSSGRKKGAKKAASRKTTVPS